MEALMKDWVVEELKVSKSDLARLSKRVTGQLPPRYAKIITEYGIPSFDLDGRYFDVAWSRIDGEVVTAPELERLQTEFLTFGFLTSETVANVLDMFERYAPRDGGFAAPPHFFPFAQDVYSLTLVFDLSPERHGQIYAWQPVPEPWGEGENRYIGFVADSLDDFLFNRLRDGSTDDFVPGAG